MGDCAYTNYVDRKCTIFYNAGGNESPIYPQKWRTKRSSALSALGTPEEVLGSNTCYENFFIFYA